MENLAPRIHSSFGLVSMRKLLRLKAKCFTVSCWDLGRTNSPTSARHEDSFRYIRIWATPPRRLVF